MRPTIVLVHGAFAESASCHRVIDPPALQRYMAERARAQRTVAVEGASHAITVSRPDATVHPILEAAALRVAA
jgi:pimeloyl-ACP methyl ester carboxylesterase